MQLLSLKLSNFGLYKGTYAFDLSIPNDLSHRNTVIIRGHNGAGKSTLFTALQLALFGPMAIGDRVTASEYSDYLYSRFHRPLAGDDSNFISDSMVAVTFTFVRSGTPVLVHVERLWHSNGRVVSEKLVVTENGSPVEDMVGEEYAHHLSDLFPVGLGPLCFFDAEPIGSHLAGSPFAEQAGLQVVSRLVGIDLVDRLSVDLEQYLIKQGGGARRLTAVRELVVHHQIQVDIHTKQIEALVAEEQELNDNARKLRNTVNDQSGYGLSGIVKFSCFC